MLHRYRNRTFLTACLAFILPLAVSAESVNLTTYYPAPSGIYANLFTTGNSYFATNQTTLPYAQVGIGTTGTLIHTLQVYTPTDGGIGIDAPTGINSVLDLMNKEIDNWGLYNDGADNTLRIRDYHANGGAGQDDVIIKSGGNIGIGTTTPATTLDVNGSVTLEKGTTGKVLCLAAGNVIGHCTSIAVNLTGTCPCLPN